jgi:hypothetical protein
MPFKQNLTSVGTSATLLCTTSGVAPDASGILVNNQGSAAVFVGSATVTTSGATAGISVAAGTTVLVPTSGASSSLALYGISGTAGQNVATLFPG